MTLRIAAWLVLVPGCQSPPAADVPEPSGCLADLAQCVEAGIKTAQREPEENQLSGFIASIADTVACPPVGASDPVEIDGRPVRWSRTEDNWSHHDDGRAEVHIRYDFAMDGCDSVSFTVDLTMGGHQDQ